MLVIVFVKYKQDEIMLIKKQAIEVIINSAKIKCDKIKCVRQLPYCDAF